MAVKDETREINGKVCFCRQWPATKAMKMKAKLVKIGGSSILPFVEGVADINSMLDMERNADSEELVQLIKEFVCEVRVEAEEITHALFDQKYKGELWFVVKLFAFSCEVQFKDFFTQGLAELQK